MNYALAERLGKSIDSRNDEQQNNRLLHGGRFWQMQEIEQDIQNIRHKTSNKSQREILYMV
jgi:hypothetical protein